MSGCIKDYKRFSQNVIYINLEIKKIKKLRHSNIYANLSNFKLKFLQIPRMTLEANIYVNYPIIRHFTLKTI